MQLRFSSAAFAMALVVAASAQGQAGPNVTVINSPSNPVPVTGTVTVQGGLGNIGGAVRSADQTVTLHDAIITVSSTTGGNHATPQIPVKDYKEVRLVVQRGSCTGCGDPILASVFVQGNGGLTYQIDEFPVSEAASGIGFFATRTYTVPGQTITVGLRATTSSNNSVRVLLLGRSN